MYTQYRLILVIGIFSLSNIGIGIGSMNPILVGSYFKSVELFDAKYRHATTGS